MSQNDAGHAHQPFTPGVLPREGCDVESHPRCQYGRCSAFPLSSPIMKRMLGFAVARKPARSLSSRRQAMRADQPDFPDCTHLN
jgi:hypothetical protein